MPKMCANRSLTSSVLHLKGGTLIISFTRRVFYMVKRFISITMLQMKAMKMIEKNNCCDEGDCLWWRTSVLIGKTHLLTRKIESNPLTKICQTCEGWKKHPLNSGSVALPNFHIWHLLSDNGLVGWFMVFNATFNNISGQTTKYIYIYIIYVWKLNQTVLELDFRAVKFLFFPRRDLNPHHWYTAAPFA